jgi:AcrR family transcriptional regulator
MRVFAATPYRAAGTAQIAREAGVAEPTIYRHFSSKRELYLAAIERTCTEILDVWEAIVAGTPNAVEAIHLLGDWYHHSIETDRVSIRLRHRAAAEAEDDEVREALRSGYERIHALIASAIRRGQEQGMFSPNVDAAAGAWLFMAVGQLMDVSMIIGLDPRGEPMCANVGEVFLRGMLVDPDSVGLLKAGHPQS